MTSRKELQENYENMAKSHKNYGFEDLVGTYKDYIEPYLGVITDFKAKKKITDKQVCYVLGVPLRKFTAIRQFIPELADACNAKHSVMEFKASVDLQKGIAMKPTSGKLLEMQFIKFDDEYKKKDEEQQQQAPTLKFEVVNAKISDEELDKKAPKLE